MEEVIIAILAAIFGGCVSFAILCLFVVNRDIRRHRHDR